MHSPGRPYIMVKIAPEVQISGKVTTEGGGTTPTSVDFLSDYGQPFSTPVVSGLYSIPLGNHHSYSATVHYSMGFGIIAGTCNAGPLPVYVNSSSLKYDFLC